MSEPCPEGELDPTLYEIIEVGPCEDDATWAAVVASGLYEIVTVTDCEGWDAIVASGLYEIFEFAAPVGGCCCGCCEICAVPAPVATVIAACLGFPAPGVAITLALDAGTGCWVGMEETTCGDPSRDLEVWVRICCVDNRWKPQIAFRQVGDPNPLTWIDPNGGWTGGDAADCVDCVLDIDAEFLTPLVARVCCLESDVVTVSVTGRYCFWWCVDGECVRACEEPEGATSGPHNTLAECEAVCVEGFVAAKMSAAPLKNSTKQDTKITLPTIDDLPCKYRGEIVTTCISPSRHTYSCHHPDATWSKCIPVPRKDVPFCDDDQNIRSCRQCTIRQWP